MGGFLGYLNRAPGYTQDEADARFVNLNQIGTGANQLVQLDGSSRLPAIDASQLINAPDTVPTGAIFLWSGSIATIPSGYHICDGTNGTPNLTGKFVVHADADSGGTYYPGATGGQNAITEVPEHAHTFSGNTGDAGGHSHTGTTSNTGAHTHTQRYDGATTSLTNGTYLGGGARASNSYSGTINVGAQSAGNHSHTFSTDVAPDHAHTVSGNTDNAGNASVDVRPPYYALAYIMKL